MDSNMFSAILTRQGHKRTGTKTSKLLHWVSYIGVARHYVWGGLDPLLPFPPLPFPPLSPPPLPFSLPFPLPFLLLPSNP